jgi:hypothetical protein
MFYRKGTKLPEGIDQKFQREPVTKPGTIKLDM